MVTNSYITAKAKEIRLFVTRHENQLALGIIFMYSFFFAVCMKWTQASSIRTCKYLIAILQHRKCYDIWHFYTRPALKKNMKTTWFQMPQTFFWLTISQFTRFGKLDFWALLATRGPQLHHCGNSVIHFDNTAYRTVVRKMQIFRRGKPPVRHSAVNFDGSARWFRHIISSFGECFAFRRSASDLGNVQFHTKSTVKFWYICLQFDTYISTEYLLAHPKTFTPFSIQI